jgi:hypothetical protein
VNLLFLKSISALFRGATIYHSIYIPMAKGFCYLMAVMDLRDQEGVVLQIIEDVRYFLLHRGS